MSNKLSVVVVEPNTSPYVKDIPDTLEGMQREVDGLIETVRCDGLPDGTVIVCNEEGKIHRLEPNRMIFTNGFGPDIIFGTFFVTGDVGEDFVSLTQEQIDAVTELFE